MDSFIKVVLLIIFVLAVVMLNLGLLFHETSLLIATVAFVVVFFIPYIAMSNK